MFYRPDPVKPFAKTAPKYRILTVGEIINAGDQWYNKDTRGWNKASSSVGRPTFVNGARVRRKVS